MYTEGITQETTYTQLDLYAKPPAVPAPAPAKKRRCPVAVAAAPDPSVMLNQQDLVGPPMASACRETIRATADWCDAAAARHYDIAGHLGHRRHRDVYDKESWEAQAAAEWWIARAWEVRQAEAWISVLDAAGVEDLRRATLRLAETFARHAPTALAAELLAQTL